MLGMKLNPDELREPGPDVRARYAMLDVVQGVPSRGRAVHPSLASDCDIAPVFPATTVVVDF
jgi:hypothetical protein